MLRTMKKNNNNNKKKKQQEYILNNKNKFILFSISINNYCRFTNLVLCIIVLCQILLLPIVECGGGGISDDTTKIRVQSEFYATKVGETVNLPCEIENRGQAAVIWQFSKSRIPETLTIGFLQYRQDYRIRVISNLTSDKVQSWNLEIRKVRFEDEGYYFCRVMAQHESLKRAIYLSVEVTMSISPIDPYVNLKDTFTILCNTSYVVPEGTKKSHSSNLHINWFKKDDIHFLKNQHNNNTNYKIEYYTKPTVHSKLKILHMKSSSFGTYTCKFRTQNISTTLQKAVVLNKKSMNMDPNSNSVSSFRLYNYNVLIVSKLFVLFILIFSK